MEFVVLGTPESWYCERLEKAIVSRRHGCRRWSFQTLRSAIRDQTTLVTGDENWARPDVIVVRSMPPGSLEQVVFRMNALAQLAQQDVLIVNSPESLECAIDKYLTSARLASAGLPVPPTAVCENFEVAIEAFESLGQDVVVKPLFGSEGRGIVRVSDHDMAWRVFRAIERTGGLLYLQQFVAHAGYDVRVMVLDNEVLGAIRRDATCGFRTNVAQQGRAGRYELNEHERQLAVRAAEVCRTQFAGVDLLHGESGTMVLEVNAVPGWRAFEKVTRIRVVDRFLDWIEINAADRSKP